MFSNDDFPLICIVLTIIRIGKEIYQNAIGSVTQGDSFRVDVSNL